MIKSWWNKRGAEVLVLSAFILLLFLAILLPVEVSTLSASGYAGSFNAAVSIATGGIVSFLFYFVVNERGDARRRHLLLQSAAMSYAAAKKNILVSVILASYKGGRFDLVATSTVIDGAMTPDGFKAIFEGGREADEGFYAFENQMSEATPEFDEILFNFRQISRAADRLVDGVATIHPKSYQYFMGISTAIARAERNGAGYDESKLLCTMVWEMFTGWSPVIGELGGDPFELALRDFRPPKPRQVKTGPSRNPPPPAYT